MVVSSGGSTIELALEVPNAGSAPNFQAAEAVEPLFERDRATIAGGSMLWLLVANANFDDGCAQWLDALAQDADRTKQAALRSPTQNDRRVAVFRVAGVKVAER